MKYLILIASFLFLCFPGKTQSDLDRMRNELDQSIDDTSRIQILIDLANECRFYAPEEIRKYNEEALQLSSKTEYSLGEGLALKSIGQYHYDKARFDSAQYYFNQAEVIFRKLENKKELSSLIGSYCYLCIAQGEYNKALESAMDALRLANESGDESQIQEAHYFLGYTYFSIGDKEQAIEEYNKSIKIAERLQDRQSIADLKSKIAAVHEENQDYDKAVQLYSEAAALLRQEGHPHALGIATYNIAESNRCLGNFDDAISSYFEAHAITTKLGDVSGTTLILTRIGEVYLDKLESGESVGKINVLIARNGFKNIDQLLTENAIELETTNKKDELLTNYFSLAGLNKFRQQYQAAFEYNNKLIALKDTLASINKSRALSRLLTNYRIEQEQKALELIEAQTLANEERIVTQRQQLTIVIAVVVLLVLIAFALRNRIRTIRKVKLELHHTNDQLEKEKSRAERSEKFKEQFLANVSHEIRTPMNAIMGITNILVKNQHYREQEKYLDAMNISSRHLLGLINDILDLSKLESGRYNFEKTNFSIRSIISQVSEELNAFAMSKKLNLSIKVNENIPSSLLGDERMLKQVLTALCRNGIEYTTTGGVDVFCRLNGVTENIAIIGFTVRDTGVGINKGIHKKMFSHVMGEVQFDKQQFETSGLELVIIKQMLELQGGNISFDSETKKGTTFYFEIPYEISKEEVPQVIENINDSPTMASKLSILLVEDNEFNVMVAKDELEDAIKDVLVEVAEDGKVALSKLAVHDYDIILMDLQMPVMNGFEATRAIRAMKGSKSKIPIIAMTANVLKSEVDKCFEVGMNAYISKPFETKELIAELYKHLS